MTNNKQQTAVEWLQSIELERDLTLADWKQAKEMEKQRMIDFAKKFIDVVNIEDKDIENIYEQTYGGNK
jgi:hypothetical protein